MNILKAVNISRLDIAIGIALVLLAFFLPYFSLNENESIIGAVTAVFAITAGFFIVDATENYLALQRLIAEENAALVSIGHSLAPIPDEYKNKIKDAIDLYMIAQLDSDNLDHTVRTRFEFDALIDSIDVVDRMGGVEGRSEQVNHIQEQKDRLIQTNQEITLAAQSNLTYIHWFVLFLLACLVGVSALALRDHSLRMQFIVAGIIIGVQVILVVLRDLDNNRFLQRKLSFRNPQQVFRSIGRAPYYPFNAPKRLCVADQDGHYRTKKEGKTVTVESNVCTV